MCKPFKIVTFRTHFLVNLCFEPSNHLRIHGHKNRPARGQRARAENGLESIPSAEAIFLMQTTIWMISGSLWPQATGKIMHTVTERSGFPDMSSGYVTLLPGSFRCLDADVTRMKLGYQHSETVKKAVHSSDVICFSGIKDSGRALLLRLMRGCFWACSVA